MKKYALFLILSVLWACTKNDPVREDPNGTKPAGNNGNGTTTPPKGEHTPVTLENSTFTGSVIVTFTDNTKVDVAFTSGKGFIPLSSSGDKTIASLQPANEALILIGRKEKADITLNYSNAKLSHRVAIDGFIPIGTYAEFQLIGNDAGTLANNYKLEADLDLMNIEWTPIGKYKYTNGPDYSKAFKGNFDGGNHHILNLKISVSTFEYTSLLGVAAGSETNFIKNIIIKTGEIAVGTDIYARTATVVNRAKGYTIENCINYISVKGSGKVGGIGTGAGGAEKGGKYKNCHNYGHLQGYDVAGISNHVGSFFSNSYDELTDCTNRGKIEAAAYVAGISSEGIAINCTDEGEIKGKHFAAGIVFSGSAKDCTNEGKVDSEVYAAGIVSSISTQCSVENCINKGNVTGNEYAAGVLLVWGTYKSGSASKCKNTGTIRGKMAGGVGVNNRENNITIQDCTNEGEVHGQNVGGIIGDIKYEVTPPDYQGTRTIKNCNNQGNVYGTGDYVGGIASYGVVTGSSNSGIVKGAGKNTGGIVGDGEVDNCENKGVVYGTEWGINYTGGIIGRGSAKNSKNTGEVHGNGYGTGGIAGGIERSEVNGCENRGNVSGTGRCTAGIVGYAIGGVVKNCTNYGNVTGKGEYATGIGVYLNTIYENNFNYGTIYK